MSNPVCISPLKFYDSPAKQNHRKSYAYGHISPLITKTGWIPPFQFVIPVQQYKDSGGFNQPVTHRLSEYSNIGILKIDGGINQYSNFRYSDYIEIDTDIYDKLSYTNVYPNTDGTHCGLITYNAQKEIIANYGGTGEITLNSNVKYVRFSGSKNAGYYNISIKLIDSNIYNSEFRIYKAKSEELAYTISHDYIEKNFKTLFIEGNYVLIHLGKTKLDNANIKEGNYYLKIASANGGLCTYYSEVFCFDNITKDCLELEYWNETGNFVVKNGVIAFPTDFHFKLLLKGEIGKPEYNFEEESTKRLGYIYVESQVSKKTYKFNTVVPEYICDALRLVRLCDNKIIRCKDDEYEAITFEMEAEWQTQGDLASVTCEFETDNVIANIGGFVPDKLGGDYNNDYNEDFDKE